MSTQFISPTLFPCYDEQAQKPRNYADPAIESEGYSVELKRFRCGRDRSELAEVLPALMIAARRSSKLLRLDHNLLIILPCIETLCIAHSLSLWNSPSNALHFSLNYWIIAVMSEIYIRNFQFRMQSVGILDCTAQRISLSPAKQPLEICEICFFLL